MKTDVVRKTNLPLKIKKTKKKKKIKKKKRRPNY